MPTLLRSDNPKDITDKSYHYHILTRSDVTSNWFVSAGAVFTSYHQSTGCSLNIVFFSKSSQKIATFPSPALGCHWLYKKLPANRSDCTLALRWELEGLLQRCRRGRCCSELLKKTIFPEHPVAKSFINWYLLPVSSMVAGASRGPVCRAC